MGTCIVIPSRSDTMFDEGMRMGRKGMAGFWVWLSKVLSFSEGPLNGYDELDIFSRARCKVTVICIGSHYDDSVP